MPTEPIHLLGAGGHARVVIDALRCCGWDQHHITLHDDCVDLVGGQVLGCPIQGPAQAGAMPNSWIHAAIGDNAARRRVLERCGINMARWLNVRHPSAVVAESATVGAACFFAARSVTGPCTWLGRSVIINHGAIVDHDCQVGDFSHIAPGATLGGGVRVGQGVLVGSGAIVLPGVVIGDYALVGAGAVVLANVAAGITVAGVPAHTINKRTR